MISQFFKEILKNNLILLLIILLIVVILYYPVFYAQYVWDDLLLFVANSELRNNNVSWEVLSKPILAGASYFRPFVLLSFMVEFSFSDADPFVSHIINLIFFLFNIILLYILINIFTKRLGYTNSKQLAMWGALIYALHPALIETTAWVSGRFDLFAATFILLGLIFNFVLKNKFIKLIFISLSLLIALSSKEIGIILIPALFIIHLILLQSDDHIFKQIGTVFKKNMSLWLSLTATFIFYLFVRIEALGHVYNNSPLVDEIYLIKGWKFVLPLQTFAFYLKSILFPFFSSPVHVIEPDFINSPLGKAITGLSGILILLLGYFSLICRNKSALLFSVGFLAILPVMHIVTLRILDNIGHDRFLTVPLIFLIMGFVLLPWKKLAQYSALIFNVFKIIFVIWIGACILTISTVLPLWSTELKLWSWAYHQQPNSKIARASYIAALQREGQNNLLGPLFEKIKDDMDIKEQLIYSAYLIDHQNPEGILYLRGVLESVKPFHELYKTPKEAQQFVNMFDPLAYGYFQLSGYYLIYQHDYRKAYKNAQIALWYFPNSPPIITRNALALYGLGHKGEADLMFEKAIKAYHYTERETAFRDRYNFISHECYWKRIPKDICEDKILLKVN